MSAAPSSPPTEEVNGVSYIRPLKRVERLMNSCAEAGARINVISWAREGPGPDKPPRGAILFMHGYGHYCGLIYDFLATQLWYKCGMQAFAIEHYGHGKSEGLGAYISDFGNLVADVLAWTTHIREKELPPGTPLFAYGESLGGGLAITCALKAPNAFSGLVLFAPMVGVSEGVEPNAVVVAIGKLAAKLAPTLAAAPVKDILSLCFSDRKMYEVAKVDPFRYSGKMRLGTAFQLKEAMEHLTAHATELSVPFVCFHGSGDKITSHHASEQLFNRCRSADKTLIIPENAYHVQWFEPLPTRRKMLDDLCDWLNTRCLKKNESSGEVTPGELTGRLPGDRLSTKRVGCKAEGVVEETPDMHIYTLASHPQIYGDPKAPRETLLPKGGVVERPTDEKVKEVLSVAPPRLQPTVLPVPGRGEYPKDFLTVGAPVTPLPPVETSVGEMSPAHGVIDAVVKKIESTSTMVVAAEASSGM